MWDARHQPGLGGRRFLGRFLGHRCLFGFVVLCLLAGSPQTCAAQTTARDAQIIARALSFSDAGPTGTLEIGIVYAPDQANSLRQAESLRASIGESLVAGRVTLRSRLVPVDHLDNVTGLAGLFVTSDLGPHLDAIAATAQRLHIPTISNEMAYVRAGRCILAYSSQPNVEIVLNHDAANKAGVHFTQAFRMLVREL